MSLLVALAAFVAMEPVSYAMHRWVMHGRGFGLHASHHRRNDDGRFELNDWFPVMTSAFFLVLAAAGASIGPLALLLPTTIGAAAYGLAYVFVHDVYIHRRLRLVTTEVPVLERLKEAHRIHHLWSGEPFGMLVPIVPKVLRARAAEVGYDPFPSAKGSRPLHVPVDA